MGILSRFFFQKRTPELDLARIEHEQRMRFNPLRGFDPDKLVRAIDSFRVGELGDLSKIIDELENRDDMMTGCARKARASVGRCPHRVLITEGYEDDPRALEHQKILTRFWANIEVTTAFQRNERGGVRLLKKQMMNAVSRVYNVHEIVWKPLPDGSITATFVQVPLWFFEGRTGALRFLRSQGALAGEEMLDGEWLVTVGDGIGIAAAVLAMSKTLSRNDWLLFCERCGQPGLHIATDAADGSTAWARLVSAARNFGREWSIVTDKQTDIKPVDLKVGGTLPYPGMVEMCDKGIAALYRGADLSTISGATGESTGASVQGEETDILEQDACEMISETLNAQVDRFVIRYVTGDDVPLAYVSIAPSDRPNVDQDIKIDNHLAGLGVELSQNDALARYGRSAYDPANAADAPLKLQTPPQTQPYGFPNDRNDVKPVANPLQKRLTAKDATTDGLANESPRNAPDATLGELAKSLAADLRPLAERIAALLDLPEAERIDAAQQLAKELPGLLPDDPQMAAILEASIAETFAATLAPTKATK